MSTPASLASFTVFAGTPVQIATWTRSDKPFSVTVRVYGTNGVFIATSAAAAPSGFRLDGISGDLVLHVPEAEEGVTAPTEDLYASIPSAGAAISVAIDPA